MSEFKEYIVKVYENRTEWYNKDGQLHREDGPAIEWSNGSKQYYQIGKLHRLDGPALELSQEDCKKNYPETWAIFGTMLFETFPENKKHVKVLRTRSDFIIRTDEFEKFINSLKEYLNT